MFDNLQKVKIYEEALELLNNPALNDKEVWVHDYTESVYREKKNYTLNGLHWGYPDSIADNITGKHVEGVRSIYYARFVGKDIPPAAEKWNYEDNSRFSKVKYGEIKEIVELGIKQKLAKSKIDAKGNIKELKKWKKYIAKEYSNYNSIIRIEEIDGEKIHVIVLKPEEMDTFGFGSFLSNIKAGDISFSEKALEILKSIPERPGLNSLEFFSGKRFAMIGTNPDLIVQPDQISVVKGALKEIK